ncbi:MAG TPA: Calx-beta domain-containing protein, partial [Tichowtungia sp.]|nr:Calx-beta domain-containing protein [Tichowtungia sp.]
MSFSTSGPGGGWFSAINTNAQGGSLARSAVLPAGMGGNSSMMSTLTLAEPQLLSFDYWVLDGIYFNFYVNGMYMDVPHGQSGGPFHFETVLEAGENNLEWSPGGPSGYMQLDNIVFAELPPAVSFESGFYAATSEGEGSVEVNLLLDSPGDDPITVFWTVSGTASSGVDFTLSPPDSVTFAAGQTNASILVELTDDAIPEAAETLQLTLLTDAAYRLGVTTEYTLTIPLNDGMPQITAFTEQNSQTSVGSPDIILNLIADGSPQEYRISENEDFSGASWMPFTNSPAFTLSEGFGSKTIWVEVRTDVPGYGYIVPSAASLSLSLNPSLASALGVDDVETSGSALWFGQTAVSRDG